MKKLLLSSLFSFFVFNSQAGTDTDLITVLSQALTATYNNQKINMKAIMDAITLAKKHGTLNTAFYYGDNALSIAIHFKSPQNFKVVKALLKAGANVQVTKKNGSLSLSTAIMKGDVNIIRLLLDNLKTTGKMDSPIMEAFLTQAQLPNQAMPLLVQAFNTQNKAAIGTIVDLLIGYGANPDLISNIFINYSKNNTVKNKGVLKDTISNTTVSKRR